MKQYDVVKITRDNSEHELRSRPHHFIGYIIL